MQVILLEPIGRLGQMGDTVKVRDGYARNFLLPQGKALRATKDNMKRFDKERAQLEATNLHRKQEAEAVSVKLKGLRFVVLRQAGDSGQLYGSVSTRDIADLSRMAASPSTGCRCFSTGPLRIWVCTMFASVCIPRSRSRWLSTWRAPRKKPRGRLPVRMYEIPR